MAEPQNSHAATTNSLTIGHTRSKKARSSERLRAHTTLSTARGLLCKASARLEGRQCRTASKVQSCHMHVATMTAPRPGQASSLSASRSNLEDCVTLLAQVRLKRPLSTQPSRQHAAILCTYRRGRPIALRALYKAAPPRVCLRSKLLCFSTMLHGLDRVTSRASDRLLQ